MENVLYVRPDRFDIYEFITSYKHRTFLPDKCGKSFEIASFDGDNYGEAMTRMRNKNKKKRFIFSPLDSFKKEHEKNLFKCLRVEVDGKFLYATGRKSAGKKGDYNGLKPDFTSDIRNAIFYVSEGTALNAIAEMGKVEFGKLTICDVYIDTENIFAKKNVVVFIENYWKTKRFGYLKGISQKNKTLMLTNSDENAVKMHIDDLEELRERMRTLFPDLAFTFGFVTNEHHTAEEIMENRSLFCRAAVLCYRIKQNKK